MTIVTVSNETYGDCDAVARDVSARELSIVMGYAPPIGTVMKVHFCLDGAGSTGAPFAAIVVVVGHAYLEQRDEGAQRVVRMQVERFL